MPGTIESYAVPIDADTVKRVDEFRRQQNTAMLAIMFVDAADSTRRRIHAGEVIYEQDRRAFVKELWRLIADAHNSEVIKDTGDGVLAVFSEPDNSVRCALNIQREFGHLNSPIRVRIGLDIGQVSTVDTGVSRDVFGHQVNRAARLGQLGEAGHILASMSLWDAAHLWLTHVESIHWRRHDECFLKGIDTPQAVFEVLDNSVKPLQSLRGSQANQVKNKHRGRSLRLTNATFDGTEIDFLNDCTLSY